MTTDGKTSRPQSGPTQVRHGTGRLLGCDKDELKQARAPIASCGYWRRKEELEDAERMIGG
jgi:hypothetical protein